jgi:hypothetical protein
MLSAGQIFWVVYANSDEKSAYVIRGLVNAITPTKDKDDLVIKYLDLSDGGSFNSRRESELYLSNFNYLDVKNTKKLNYIFSNLLDADKFIKAVEAGEIIAERLTLEDRSYGVHMSHCFGGHHSHGCKYGESDICPAKPP